MNDLPLLTTLCITGIECDFFKVTQHDIRHSHDNLLFTRCEVKLGIPRDQFEYPNMYGSHKWMFNRDSEIAKMTVFLQHMFSEFLSLTFQFVLQHFPHHKYLNTLNPRTRLLPYLKED